MGKRFLPPGPSLRSKGQFKQFLTGGVRDAETEARRSGSNSAMWGQAGPGLVPPTLPGAWAGQSDLTHISELFYRNLSSPTSQGEDGDLRLSTSPGWQGWGGNPRPPGTRRLTMEILGPAPCHLPTSQSEERHTLCRHPPIKSLPQEFPLW